MWTPQAISVAKNRYYWHGEKTPEDMCLRVANAVAEAEIQYCHEEHLADFQRQKHLEWADKFYDLMINQYFMPNSPTIMNAGTGNNQGLAACFTLKCDDSMESILKALSSQVMIHKSGGGTGIPLSNIRPEGCSVNSTSGIASGPISFLSLFDKATEVVVQGGRRRGANLSDLSVSHPDIMKFIRCKLTGGITNFNISVAVNNNFMEMVLRDDDSYYPIIDPRDNSAWDEPEESLKKRLGDGVRYQRIKDSWYLSAKDVFKEICKAAWRNGDPGLLFLERANDSLANPCPDLFQIEVTNPCGEQYLDPWNACNLGSINLGKYVLREGKWPYRIINFDLLKEHVRIAVRFLDNVIDINPYIIPEIQEKVLSTRRIGLGIMGWADMLLLMGVPYDSEEAIDLANLVMGTINTVAVDESEVLAMSRGEFPLFSKSRYAGGTPRRNSNLTTVAPTGSISFFASCSSGCEPIFSLDYTHRDGEGTERRIINPVFLEISESIGIDIDDLSALDILRHFPKKYRKVFVSAREVSVDWHIKMQSAFQSNIDNSVSKTVNLPYSAIIEDVEKAYKMAYELGCLGITVYREGSREIEVINDNVTSTLPHRDFSSSNSVVVRPEIVKGSTIGVQSPHGKVYVTINEFEEGNPREIFIVSGKSGSDVQAFCEAVGRMSSLLLRANNMSMEQKLEGIIGQLDGIGGSGSVGFGNTKVKSLPDAISFALKRYVESYQKDLIISKERESADLCPFCGTYTLMYEEGCKKCYSCLYAEC